MKLPCVILQDCKPAAAQPLLACSRPLHPQTSPRRRTAAQAVKGTTSRLLHPTSARSGSPRTLSHPSSPRRSQKQQQQPVMQGVHPIWAPHQNPQSMPRTGPVGRPAGRPWHWATPLSPWSWSSAVTLWGRLGQVPLWHSPSGLRLTPRSVLQRPVANTLCWSP